MGDQEQSLGIYNNILQDNLKFQNINLSCGDHYILKDIQGEVFTQNILVLMGPSGSGKSSLLNVLSFRHELLGQSVCSGYIALNNVPLTKKDRYRIGYVMQEDIFFPTLTLYETLTFYVNLRVSSTYSLDEKDAIIRKLSQYMHLEKCMNTIMGGGITRGLSGGERKRASVACELITDPVILMLDEPTSGLDSFMASTVINILKDYCKTRNKIVIASIHQPSSQSFHCFDRLVLLTCGKLAYEGSTKKVAEFLTKCGFQCPQQWNIADYMLDVVGSNQQSIDKIVEEFKNSKMNKDGTDNKFNSDNDYKMLSVTSIGEEDRITKKTKEKWPAGKKIQFTCLLRRNLLLSIEDQFSILSLSKAIVVSLILGTVWFNLQWDASHFQDVIGLLYYLVVENFSNPFFTSVFVFDAEKPVISRERIASMYSLLLYYMAKVLGELPVLLIRPLVHTIIVYPMAGLPRGLAVLPFIAILYSTNIVGLNFGLFISSMGLRQKETLTVMVIFFVFFDLYGGFFVSKFPPGIKWGKFVSPLFSFFVLMVHTLFSYKNLKCDTPLSMQQCANIPEGEMLGVDIVLDAINAEISYYWFILILFGTSAIINILTFITLRKTITKPATGFSLCDMCNPIHSITKEYKEKSASPST